jgi:hypothetical protein
MRSSSTKDLTIAPVQLPALFENLISQNQTFFKPYRNFSRASVKLLVWQAINEVNFSDLSLGGRITLMKVVELFYFWKNGPGFL